MRKSSQNIDGIEQAFGQARCELDRIRSSAGEIERRISATSIKPTSVKPRAGLVALLAIAAASLFGWHQMKKPPTPPPATVVVNPVDTAETGVEMGDAKLREYIAGIIDPHTVVVIWSYQGAGVVAMPVAAAGKYRLESTRESKLTDGRTIVCSLLNPEANVNAVLEPPSMYARSNVDQVISLSVQPRAASMLQLASVIRSVGDTDPGVDDMLRTINK